MSSQALLVKIVTEMLFGQCTFSESRRSYLIFHLDSNKQHFFFLAKAIKQPSWQQITDQRTKTKKKTET